jgi:hypothetical protein
LFQQNLNHWYPPNPGHFDLWFNPASNPTSNISVSNGWTQLAKFSDYAAHDMVTQTNFTFSFQAPSEVTSHGVFVARYVSLNPFEVYPNNNTDAIFYNCVDVSIIENPDLAQAEPFQEAPPTDSTASCCTPISFTASAIETNSVGTVVHDIWFDGFTQMVRWDRRGNIEESGVEDYLVTITNYTVLPGEQVNEFLILPDSKQCELYGADQFYPWCYGAAAGQEFVMNTTMEDGVEYSVWKQDNGFNWITYAKSCTPYSVSHLNDQIVFTNHFIGAINPTVFTIPAYCDSNTIRHRSCHKSSTD